MQRTSVSFTKPDAKFSLSGNYTIALYMARYMIGSQNCKVPAMFLDMEEVNTELKNAYAYASKLNTVLDASQIPTSLSIQDFGDLADENEDTSNLFNLISTYTALSEENDTACIIQFPDQGSVLLIVGHFMIDPSNGVFCVTTGPEYDIEAYVKLYGTNEWYIAQFLQEKRIEDEKKRSEPPTLTVTQKPAVKKLKTTVKKEKEVPPLPVPIEQK